MAGPVRFTDRSLFFLAGAILLCGFVLVAERADARFLLLLPVLASILLLIALLEVYRRLREARRSDAEQRSRDYSQVEALFSLYFTLKPGGALPRTRSWAASPDLLKTIMDLVFEKKPDLVVEASSGVSTLIIAYCLKRLGKGRVISLEHELRFAILGQERIVMHGLEDFASVVHAPLVQVELDGQQWVWYDLKDLPPAASIDMLIVDGPPGKIQKLARYPAVPLLHARLSDRATVVLDDGNRADEREIAARWAREYPDLTAEYLKLEKGAFLLRRGPVS
jgi:hypothetical protein